MSDGLKSILRKAAFAAALAIGLASGAAQAATLYISEFASGVSQIGSATAQVYPQAAVADQTVALSGSTALSSAFNSATRAVTLMCDEGCSVKFGSASVTAATTNFLLQQGVAYRFAVSQGTYVAAIANSAGNIPGGGSSTPTDVTIVGPLGQAAMAASVPVVLASNQSAVPISATQLPSALGQAAMAASLPVVIASNQSAIPVSATQLPAALGQTTMAASLPVTLASNQSTLTTQIAGYSFQNITTSTTTTVKSGAGVLHLVNVNADGTVASSVTIYDNTAGSGTKIGTINSLALSGAFTYDVAFSTGLTIVTTGTQAPDITVSYR